MQYCVGRSTQLKPIDKNFARACDQIDQADAMLAGLRERGGRGAGPAEQASPEADRPQIIALARRDEPTQTVTLILDSTTANVAMFAITAHADEREAHLREVQRVAEIMPEGSYGQRNRQAIAARETRVATRLRAVEQAYRTAVERDAVFNPPEPARTLRSPARAADREIELE
jgi:hypothetical protein